VLWQDDGQVLQANETAAKLLSPRRRGDGSQRPAAPLTGDALQPILALPVDMTGEPLARALGLDTPCTLAPDGLPPLTCITWHVPAPMPLWATTFSVIAGPASAPEAVRLTEASAAHMELLYQRSPLMSFTVDANGIVVSVNRTALEQLGHPAEALVGQPVVDVFHQDDREAVARHMARCIAEPDVTHAWEARKRRSNGDVMWVAEWARAVPGKSGDAELLVVCEDVSARKRAEQALRESEALLLQAQKQEALGRLAGGIAHDFGNLLTVVLGHCDAARQLVGRDSPVLDELQGIREAAQQATNLSRQLLTFSRRQVVQPQPLQLDDLVARMTPLFRRLLGSGVALDVVWLPGLPRVHADPGQIEQVLTNLVVNARDAVGDHGRVRIASSLVGASAFTDDTGVTGQPGRTYLCLAIRDNGSGMSDDVKRRAFEPFFTTKADDRGTGLGLPTVQAIVQQAGGGVAIHSAPGEGCEVRVYLPTLAGSSTPAPPAPDTRHLPGGHETILLVEDREAVRRVAHRFLARRGYRVIEADSAERALEIAETQGHSIDLLLSDVVLGGMDGYALAVTLSARLPGLRIVLMSGYPSEMLARAAGTGPVFPFVNKPIDFPTLATLLRELLDSRPARPV
jgi:two-component system cell cycle sensor histidine kinase/response regulator CckA